jgi:hypothetical protein
VVTVLPDGPGVAILPVRREEAASIWTTTGADETLPPDESGFQSMMMYR